MKRDLAPIPFAPVNFLPVPDMRELPPEVGWPLWDAAVQAFDDPGTTPARHQFAPPCGDRDQGKGRVA